MTTTRPHKPGMGSALKAKLGELQPEPTMPVSATEQSAPQPTPAPPEPAQRRLGRPPKVGQSGIQVNVRMDQGDYDALADMAPEFRTPGRPLPNPQDLVRWMLRTCLANPETARDLIRRGKDMT
jgi:hypothetical protein